MFANSPEFYENGVAAMGVGAAASFLVLTLVDAPYGRFMREGFGPAVRSRFGWIAMELPSPVCFLVAYTTGEHARDPLPLLFLVLFQGHYLHRTFVYPILMRGRAKQNSALTVASAVLFNALNGFLCGLGVSQYGAYGSDWLSDPRFLVGMALFAGGMAINLQSDAILRGLRAPGESGYKIPHGGLFRWVSSPNYLGEIIEWLGFAIATWTAAGLVFALFTAANLVPRALANQRWYREHFHDYPATRRALIPGLL